jgi:hypothetical protein
VIPQTRYSRPEAAGKAVVKDGVAVQLQMTFQVSRFESLRGLMQGFDVL